MTEMERMADKTVTQKDIRDAVVEGLQPRIQKYAEAAEKAQREVEKLAAECARLERALDDLTHKKETEEEAAARAAAEEQNAMLAHVEQDIKSDTLRPHLARYADTVGDAREGVGWVMHLRAITTEDTHKAVAQGLGRV